MSRSIPLLSGLALCALASGCSIVLAPSRRQGDAGVGDAPTSDAPGLDVPALDAPGLDAPMPDAPTPDVPGLDAPMPDVPIIDGGPGDAGVDAPMAPDVPGPSCPLDFSCLPAAPSGWMGPIVLTTGSGSGSAPACPGTAPMQQFTATSGLSAPGASCDCDCNAPTSGLSCGSATLVSSNASCTAGSTTIATLTDGACQFVTMPSSGAWTVSRPTFSSTGSCTAVPTTTVPPLSYSASHRACSAGAPMACGAGMACAPTPTASLPVCIWTSGEASCPSSFPVAIETSEGATDTRGCSACTCGGVTGTCGGYVSLENGCPGSTYFGDVSVGGCTPAESLSGVRATGHFTPTGSCPPSTPTPTGGAAPRMPRTVCCLP